ncbi:transcriptional regulator, HxlR family [Nocardia amikacinitolerans]|uniref:Transcriptional regulator, HxlR family n=1 Tax=Nocardia amikacinitolerans TaxID=756689 RepID=A0A285L1T7_9NOCA|nr:helix-turn-helix domain-containing protein [Nocardia amikacinitolerans]SNY77401.1 transcriptional regulator, HxlR family [Nocardia amikacinitolerans]
MRRTSFQAMGCPIAGALEYVGDWWTLLIVRDALDGFTRFDEFEHNLGIAPNMLTRRLRALVESGLLERRRYSQSPPRYEYLITDKGRDLSPVIVALYAWGRKHAGTDAPSVVLTDRDTGDEIVPSLMDQRSGRPLSTVNLTFLAGPGADPFMRERLDPELRKARRRRVDNGDSGQGT